MSDEVYRSIDAAAPFVLFQGPGLPQRYVRPDDIRGMTVVPGNAGTIVLTLPGETLECECSSETVCKVIRKVKDTFS